jgi:hypothetical protein
MRAPAWLCGVGMAVALAGGTLASGGALAGCGGPAGPKFPVVVAGELPAGESWPGVYYNEVYGNLNIEQQGDNVVGRWKRTNESGWGELSGTTEGNVMHFTWTEHKYGAIGVNADIKGTGQFVYTKGEAAGELKGVYALDGEQSVANWNCVKQIGKKADINSITGDNPTDAPTKGDKWQ